MKKLFTLVLALLLALSLSACGGGGEDAGAQAVVRCGLSSAWDSLMPYNSPSGSNYSRIIYDKIYDRLAYVHADGTLDPRGAESWESADGGYAVLFHLDQGAAFHDGTPVTAEHWADTIALLTDPDCPTLGRAAFSVLAGTDDNGAAVEGEALGAEAVDDYTLRLTFKTPTTPEDFLLDRNREYYVLPTHLLEGVEPSQLMDLELWDKPIGSGPFKFSEYNQGQNMILEANPDYFRGAPKLERLIISIIPDDTTAMQSLTNGELDWAINTPVNMVEQLSANEDVRLDVNQLPSPTRLVFNLENELVSDLAVRQAIAMCIDREDISEKVTNGIRPVEYSAYPSVSWAANTEDTYPALDLEAAEQVLIDAGYTKDADGYYIRGLSILTFDADGNPDVARLIAANCESIGIEMDIEVLEYNAWSQRVELDRDYVIELQGGFVGPDPAAMQNLLRTDAYSNVSGYSNTRVDELLDLAAAESDQDIRKEYYHEIQQIVVQDLPYINIMEYAVYEASSASLHDIPMDGADQWGWAEWTYAYFE